ncbi:TIGR03118 family protein [Paludisphaera soli]|uniref:TIGR03118 family protein n=1 Tax=Paludisphaera soli TaxID=2712865 RepID=UPI0013EA898F|nr:TIGR03118 family protein [Paludisphaera soli]
MIRRWTSIAAALLLAVLASASRPARADAFLVKNLVTDDPSVNPAVLTDPSLKNAWGLSATATGPFWVSANGTGLSTLYRVDGATDAPTKLGLEVSIPGDGSVTGQVANPLAAAGAFNGDAFLFASEDGTISGWRGALGTTAEVLQTGLVDNVYKGMTSAVVDGHAYVYSANFRLGTVDVLKGDGGAPDLTGRFTDPGLPSGYAPFGIQRLGDTIYVTYALQDAAKEDDVAGAGHGFVTAFDLQGNFLNRIGSAGMLDSPWGLAIAPSTFGSFAGDLLVGNFGDGRINVFDPTGGGFLGQLGDSSGRPLVIDGLWGLMVGNGGLAGSPDKLYFAAGPNGEAHGLFGVIQAVPEPSSVLLLLSGSTVALWAGARRRASKLG